MRYFIFLIVFFINNSFFFAQSKIDLNQGSIAPRKYVEQIPYSFVKGKILVDVIIRNKTYKFLLDTGAPFAVSEKIYKELALKKTGVINIQDASGKQGEITVTQLPEMSLGNIVFKNSPGVVLQEDNKQIFECFGIDGIIGSNILRNSVLHFDHLDRKIILTDRDKNINLDGILYQKMELTETQSNPFINIILKKGENDASDKLLLDTGADSFYDMSVHGMSWLRDRVDVFDTISEGEGTFTWGIHGMSDSGQHFILKIPELIINDYTFKNIITTTSNSSESRIGSELLKKGKITMDYRKKRFYFEPYGKLEIKDGGSKNWGIAPSLKEDKMVVGIIWDKKLETSINIGDEILSIDDVCYESMSFCDLILSEINFNKEIIIIRLKDIHTGGIKEVKVDQLK